MKKNVIKSVALLLVLFSFSACKKEIVSDVEQPGIETPSNGETITKEGNSEGVKYSFKDVALNSDLLTLNKENIELKSNSEELKDGLVKFKVTDDEVLSKLTENRIVFISTNDNTYLKKITSITKKGTSDYELTTTVAELGEAFDGGEINVTFDLENYSETKKLGALNIGDLDKNYLFNILDLQDTYNKWGFEYSPATKVNMSIDVKIKFGKLKVVPSEVSSTFILNMNVNPKFAFKDKLNHNINEDLMNLLPKSILDRMREKDYEVNIPLNVAGIGNIPIIINLQDIYLPTTIDANLNTPGELTYGINGIVKIGTTLKINGLKITNSPIFDNSLKFTQPTKTTFDGELMASTGIILKPSISILNNSFKVGGDFNLAFDTESQGTVTSAKKSTFASIGTFKANSKLDLDLSIAKRTVEILNKEKQLWKIGKIEKSIEFSNLRSKVSSTNTTNILKSTRSYITNFDLNYKYSVSGKKIPSELFITYDIYQSNGKKIETIKNLSIKPQSITSSGFSFSLNIPFKKSGGIFSTSYETESYIKNITITDNAGYTYKGILNPTTKKVENSFLIKR